MTIRRMWVLALSSFVLLSGCELIATKRAPLPQRSRPGDPPESSANTTPASRRGRPAPASRPGRKATPAREDTSGLPARLVELVQEQYATLQIDQRNHIYAIYRSALEQFEQRWPAYAKRKVIVDAALARAQKLEKAGNAAATKAALQAVITPVKLGRGTPKRELLETRDAEWPALQMLVRVTTARRSEDYTPLPVLLRVAAGLWVRRPVASREEEMWLHLAQHKDTRRMIRTLAAREPKLARAITTLEAMHKNGSTPGRRAAFAALEAGKAPKKLLGYVNRRKGSYNNPSPKKMFVEVAAEIERFLPRWRPYRARAVVVATALAKANALEASGKLAEARRVLEAVVTAPPAPGSKGKLEVQRGYIEVIDAELPALRALERVVAKQKDVAGLARFFAYRYVRRPVTSLDEELTAHLLRGDRTYDGRDGAALSSELWRVFKKNGIAHGNNRLEDVKKGAPILLHVNVTEGKLKLSNRVAFWDYTGWYTQEYDCRRTSQIERIESDGYVRYRYQCKYRKRKAHFSIHARLAKRPPAWAKSVRWLYLAGKVVKPGPLWKLRNAQVVDLRFKRP